MGTTKENRWVYAEATVKDYFTVQITPQALEFFGIAQGDGR